MNFASSDLSLGISLAVAAGIMNGTFTLPMRYLGRWSWENVWGLFILVSCILMPVIFAFATVHHVAEAFSEAPSGAIALALVTGFAWGFGAIMFGQGISAIGISMGNTLVLALSAALGSLLPMFILAPERLARPQGKAIVLGTFVAVVGIALCGYAGLQRERSQANKKDVVRGGMVGKARRFWVGLLLCVGAGLLSAVFNIGFSSVQGIAEAARRLGNSAFAGSNLIWLLMLCAGAVSNLVFCGYLLRKNDSWQKYGQKKSHTLYILTILMGLLWGGSTFAYGAAAPRLGKLGPAIGWPIALTVGLLTANLCGIVAGEWKLSKAFERAWMAAGLAILVVAIVILGWSSTLA
ncbi:MAG: L-rhamnose/proton symporter RhaT [Terriglobia bacterium]